MYINMRYIAKHRLLLCKQNSLLNRSRLMKDDDDLIIMMLFVISRSDDVGALEPVLSEVTQTLNVVTADVQALKNSNTGQVQALASFG